LAIVQMKVDENSDINLEKAALLVEEAAAAGANLVVLPEMFVCPYQTNVFAEYAQKEGGAIWGKLSTIAAKEKIWLVGGSVPELGENDEIYNTCYVFDPQGNQVGKHRKVHLFDIQIKNGQRFKESDVLSPGEDLCLVETPFGKIGIMICFDIRFVEWARLLADQGADMIILPGAFNMTTGPKHWELLMRARAVDNQLFVAAASPARDSSAGYIAYGHSMVVDPWGEVLHELDEKEGILVSELDFSMNEKVRAQLPVLSARRGDLYQIGYKDQSR
ncbi:MAG: carbon-nitrogen hydrolase family protein, partial [Aeromonas veronii]